MVKALGNVEYTFSGDIQKSPESDSLGHMCASLCLLHAGQRHCRYEIHTVLEEIQIAKYIKKDIISYELALIYHRRGRTRAEASSTRHVRRLSAYCRTPGRVRPA